MKNGIIDIGSNSIRLFWKGLKEQENTQLAEDLIHTGTLKQEAMDRTASAIAYFAEKAKKEGAAKVYAFATEAVRAAKNRDDFIERVKKIVDSFELILPEQEALLGFTGAYPGKGRVAVLDIGGASTELAVGDENGLLYAHSMPLGSVRLKDYSQNENERFGYAKEFVKEYGTVPPFEKLISIGGSLSAIAATRLALCPYDPEVIHGFEMTREEVWETVQRIFAVPVEARIHIVGLHPKKTVVGPVGGLIGLAAMDYLGVKKVTLSEKDNLEGYARLRGIEV